MSMAKDLFFAQKAIVSLFSVTNKLQMQGDKYLQDITIRQMLAIPALIHAPDGKATVNHIAKQMGTTKQSAKQIVDALEKKKYLTVTPSEQDKRSLDIKITKKGEQAFRACSERTDEFLADVFCNFTSTDLEMFNLLLQKLYRYDDEVGTDIVPDASYSDEALKYHQNFVKRRKLKNID